MGGWWGGVLMLRQVHRWGGGSSHVSAARPLIIRFEEGGDLFPRDRSQIANRLS